KRRHFRRLHDYRASSRKSRSHLTDEAPNRPVPCKNDPHNADGLLYRCSKELSRHRRFDRISMNGGYEARVVANLANRHPQIRKGLGDRHTHVDAIDTGQLRELSLDSVSERQENSLALSR